MISISLISTFILLTFICVVLVEGYRDRNRDYVCQQNETKGLYIPHPGSPDKCCKETFLPDPSPLEYTRVFEQIGCPDLGVNATESADLHGALPPWAFCRCNVSRDNPEDEMPTLMWKIEACIIKTYLGKTEDLIDFQAFVNFRVTNYTDKNDVIAIVKKPNTECPEAAKALQFHNKIEAYTWCFYRKEEKVCNEPTESAKKVRDRIDSAYDTFINLMKPPCKLNLTTKGLETQRCCRTKTTRMVWSAWEESPKPRPKIKMVNGTFVGEDPFSKCIRSVVSQANSNKSDNFHYGLCIPACRHSPVVFKNETEGPEISWDFKKVFDSYFTAFTKGILKNLTKISDEIVKPQYKVHLREAINNQTQFTLDELETAYKDSRDPAEKARLYCSYFQIIGSYTHLVLAKYCFPDVDDKVFGQHVI